MLFPFFSEHPEKEHGDKGKNAGEEYHQPCKAECTMDERHDYFREPLVGCPRKGWRQKRKHVMVRHGMMRKNPFSCTDVISGITVSQECHALVERKIYKDREKQHVRNGWKEKKFFQAHGTILPVLDVMQKSSNNLCDLRRGLFIPMFCLYSMY